MFESWFKKILKLWLHITLRAQGNKRSAHISNWPPGKEYKQQMQGPSKNMSWLFVALSSSIVPLFGVNSRMMLVFVAVFGNVLVFVKRPNYEIIEIILFIFIIFVSWFIFMKYNKSKRIFASILEVLDQPATDLIKKSVFILSNRYCVPTFWYDFRRNNNSWILTWGY